MKKLFRFKKIWLVGITLLVALFALMNAQAKEVSATWEDDVYKLVNIDMAGWNKVQFQKDTEYSGSGDSKTYHTRILFQMKKNHVYLIYMFDAGSHDAYGSQSVMRATFEGTFDDPEVLRDGYVKYLASDLIFGPEQELIWSGDGVLYSILYTATLNNYIQLNYDGYERDMVDEVPNYFIFESKATIPDTSAPVIDGVSYFTVSNIENPFYLDQIMANISAWDETDGDVTDRIELIDDGGYANDVINRSLDLGRDYEVYLSVTDTSSNRAYFEFFIRVVDINAPIFSGKNSYDAKTNQRIQLDDFKNAITAVDGVEGVLAKSKILLVSDTYTNNWNKPGTYQIVYSVSDNSGNKATYTITIRNTDGVGPKYYEIGSTTTIIQSTTITKKTTIVLTISDILKNSINCIDDIDGPITNFIIESDDYTGNGSISGVYQVVIKATDGAGNVAYHTINILVEDNIPPVFIVNNFFIQVKADTILTQQDYISILQRLGLYNPQYAAQIRFLNFSNYSNNATTPGLYTFEAEIKSVSGVESTYELQVLVAATEDDVINTAPKTEWYDKYLDNVKDFWDENKVVIIIVGSALLGLILLAAVAGNKSKSKKTKSTKKSNNYNYNYRKRR